MSKPKQMTKAWLEEAVRCTAAPSFPAHAIAVAKAWARRMRSKRSVQS